MTAVAIDHFGPILSKADWLGMSRRLADRGVPFQLPPMVAHERTSIESGKFIVRDPGNNILEFKYYLDGVPTGD